MYSNSKRTLARLVMLTIAGPLAVLVTNAGVMAQNLPPPGAYQPIPNFTGVGAGVQFRKAINDRFSGVQRVAPAIATVTFANLPPEQDGMLVYCQDCKLTSPCAATGTGAWALGARSQWSCSNSPLEANLNANGNKLTNLANGTAAGDALAFGQSVGNDLSGALPNPIVFTVLGGKTPIYSNQTNPTLADSALPLLGTATTVQGPAVNITLNKPSTVASGHAMIMGYYAQTANAPTPPSGWTLIRSDSCSGGAMATYYKVAGGSEPASYTWTLANTGYTAALIDVGVAAANPVDQISPAICGATPTLSGLTTTAQPENVIFFGAAVNGNVNQVGFTQGSVAAFVTANGVLPLSLGYLTANYSTTPSITLTGTGASEVAQMISIKPASTYSSRPVLQGDGYSELTKVVATSVTAASGSNASIVNFNINGNFNVKNPIFGAKGDNVTDDTAAIQSAINAACNTPEVLTGSFTTTAPAVYFPCGAYSVTQPIVNSCTQHALTIEGESESCAVVIDKLANFPVYAQIAPTYFTANNPPITAAPIVSGSANSMNGDGTHSLYWNLKDAGIGGSNASRRAPLNGLSQYDFQAFVKFAGTGTNGHSYYLMSSETGSLSGGPTLTDHEIWVTQQTTNSDLNVWLTTSVSGLVQVPAPGAIANGTTQFLEVSYDGSTIRVFVGGVQVASHAATGTVVQRSSNGFILGDEAAGAGLAELGAGTPWLGQYQSVRISNIARNVANYTPPTAALASDGNTLILLNSDTFFDTIFQKVTYVADGTVGTNAYLMVYRIGVFNGGSAGTVIKNLSFNGGSQALLVVDWGNSKISNVGVFGNNVGLKIWQWSFTWQLENIRGQGNEAALELENNSNASLRGFWSASDSAFGMVLLDASGSYQNIFLGGSGANVALIAASGGPFTFTDVQQDVETSSSGFGMLINGNVQLIGSVIETDTNTCNVPPIEMIGGDLVLTHDAFITCPTNTNPIVRNYNGVAEPVEMDQVTVNGNRANSSAVTVPLMTNNSLVPTPQYLRINNAPPRGTVAQLPANPATGTEFDVTNCDTCTFGATCVHTTGTTFCPEKYNGSAWVAY